MKIGRYLNLCKLVKMVFGASEKIIFKMNGQRNYGSLSPYIHQSFEGELWIGPNRNWLSELRDCIGDTQGSPIPWTSKNLVLCDNDVLELSIDSSRKITAFEEDHEDSKFQAHLAKITKIQTWLYFGMSKPFESKEAFYPSQTKWRHKTFETQIHAFIGN